MAKPVPKTFINFDNTEIAFANKSNKELIRTSRLFKLMSNSMLTKLLSSVGLLAVKFNLPFARFAVKQTIYEQFCGGETLLDCQAAIDKLYENNAFTILDYGAEAKSTPEEHDEVKEQIAQSIKIAAANNSVPVVVCKLSGLADNELLERLQNSDVISDADQNAYQKLYDRVDQICQKGNEFGVCIFIDAEESWMQVTIDRIAIEMMSKYNREKVIVYNTYQLYRHDKLAQLKSDYRKSQEEGYLFGVKFVRGAYMDKERSRAEEMGYESPIQKDKSSTDEDYDEAIKFCIENYKTIGSCCATHNEKSSLYQAELIDQLGLDKKHPHLNFSQLYGMSDQITFNLAEVGYNVAKYVVYGPVKEVIPYLIRRAQENTSVTGEMGRELKFIQREIKRRKL